MGHLRNLIRKLKKNPLHQVLKKLPSNANIAFFWNRGLGDIPLELYSFKETILKFCPKARLCVITREDLKEGFMLLEGLTVYTSALLKRKEEEDYEAIFTSLNLNKDAFDHIFYKPDPAYWVAKEKKVQTPKLHWDQSFETKAYLLEGKHYAFLHLNSETVYGFEKNLSKAQWQTILQDLKEKNYTTVALGASCDSFDLSCDIDLRGKTSLFDIITHLLNSSSIFIGPDSGLLNILYFLNIQTPLKLISYFGNTNVGILQNNHPSPNSLLQFEKVRVTEGSLHDIEPSLITKLIPSHPKENHVLGFDQNICSPDFEQSLRQSFAKLRTVQKASYSENLTLENVEPTFLETLNEQDPMLCPIILAGGQATRLKTGYPKALFEIENLSLIGHFCKKIAQASSKFQKELKAFVIVSCEGHDSILHHLKEHNFFGLKEDQLILIIQDSLPFLTKDHKLVIDGNKKIFTGPSGNGGVFHLLKKLGYLENLSNISGFEIIPIDNPLAPMFLKAHSQAFNEGFDVSILACEDQSPTLGKLAKTKNGIQIIEYTQKACPELKIANTGLLSFSKDYAKKIAEQNELRYHVALKKYACFVHETLQEVEVQKFESFIFDHLNKARCKVYTAKKERIFQPLKTIDGPFGVDALKKALFANS